jgi:ssRNA-specific RNase YbeY (16S rRNA maturation enzyme)
MNFLDFQMVSESKQLPGQGLFKKWVDTVLQDESKNSEIVIRIVD